MVAQEIDIIAVVPLANDESYLRDTLIPAYALAESVPASVWCVLLTSKALTGKQKELLDKYCHTVSVLETNSEESGDWLIESLVARVSPILANRRTVTPTRIIFCPPGDDGEELCARLAARLGGHAIGRCNTIEVTAETVDCERPGWGGRLSQCLTVATGLGDIFVCQRNIDEPAGKEVGTEIEILPQEATPGDSADTLRIREYHPTTETLPPIESTRVLVSGGRGVNQAGFEQLSRLAERLGGSLAGSLPAVDNGMVPAHRQVGVSGKFVRPAVYLAVGISGTPQHLAGLSEDTSILAINADPEAPIFSVATAGVVADYQDVLPALISEFD